MQAIPQQTPAAGRRPPQLTVITNDDDAKIALYRMARIVYAETRAQSLRSVEALAAMTVNLCEKTGRTLQDVVKDESVFESLSKNSARHKDLLVDSSRADFQMCLRVVRRTLSGRRGADGRSPDLVCGATCFHREENLPEWAAAKGYIAQVDGLLFYA